MGAAAVDTLPMLAAVANDDDREEVRSAAAEAVRLIEKLHMIDEAGTGLSDGACEPLPICCGAGTIRS